MSVTQGNRSGEITRTAIDHRERLQDMESFAVRRAFDSYGAIINTLSYDLIQVESMIAARQAAGLDVPVSWLHKQQRWQTMIQQAEFRFERYGGQVWGDLGELQHNVIQHAQRSAVGLMELTANPWAITGTYNKMPIAALEQLQGVFDEGAPLHRITSKWGDEAAALIDKEMMSGLAKGIHPKQITQNILKSLDIMPYKAAVIARTEMFRAYREANRSVYAANDHIVGSWIWFSHVGPNTCAACLGMHGTEHPLDEPMGSHPNCRCTMLPKTKSWEDLGFPGVKDQKFNLGDPDSFLRNADETLQKKAFGNLGLWKGWKSGEFQLQDVIRKVDSRVWGTNRTIGSLANAQRNAAERLLHASYRQQEAARLAASAANMGKFASPQWASGIDDLLKRPPISLADDELQRIGKSIADEVERRAGKDLYGEYEKARLASAKARKSYDKAVQQYERYLYENPEIDRILTITDRMAKYPDYAKMRARLKKTEDLYNKRVATQQELSRLLSAGQSSQRPLGETVLEVMQELKPNYGKGRLTAQWTADSDDAMKAFVHDAMRYVPEEWVESFNNAGRVIRTQKGKRGYFDFVESRTGVGNVEVMAGQKQNTLGTMIHEVGHFREFTNKELVGMEARFYARRTLGEQAKHMPGYEANEYARKDQFLDLYIGKDYGGAFYELTTMGIESVFSATPPVNIRADRDYFNFIMAILAVG